MLKSLGNKGLLHLSVDFGDRIPFMLFFNEAGALESWNPFPYRYANPNYTVVKSLYSASTIDMAELKEIVRWAPKPVEMTIEEAQTALETVLGIPKIKIVAKKT